MFNTQKKVFVIAVAVCLIAILSFGTLAWFNANDSIVNTFKVADSDGNGTPDFSVDVWENIISDDPNVDEDGDGENEGDKTQDGNTYNEIAPGDTLVKNPTVENTGDYDQWIRVYVTFDEWSKISAACENQNITNDLRTWLNVDDTAWTEGNASVDGDSVTYIYYYNYKLTKGQTAVLFTEVNIPGEFEQDDMVFEDSNFTITVKAEAIQADNTGDTAQEGFTKWVY